MSIGKCECLNPDVKIYIEGSIVHFIRELEKEAKSVTEKLTSRKEFFAHGKLIGAKKAQEIGLVVEELGPSDELWQKVWEYYCRVEVGVLTRKTSPARLINTKIIETTKDLLIAQSPVRE